MSKKCILTVISFAMVILLALAACQSDSAQSGKDASGKASGLDFAELTWYTIGDGQPLDMDIVMDELNVMLKERINASLNLQVIDWGSFGDRIQIMSSAGEAFDLCFSSSWTNLYVQAAQGYYADLTDLIPAHAPELQDIISQELFDAFKVKGQIMAVPNLQGMVYKDYVLFNSDIAAKYDIPDKVDGLEGLEPYFAAIKEGEPDLRYIFYLAGLADTSMGSFTFCHPDRYQRAFNVGNSGVYKRENPDGSLEIVWGDQIPGSMANARWKRMAYLNGWIPADILTLQFNREEFLNGNAAAVYFGLNPDDSKTKAQWGTNFKQVDIGTEAILFGDMISGAATSISSHSQNKERAMMLLGLVNTDPDIFNTIILGVEGKHWVRVEDGFWDLGPEAEAYNMQHMGWSIGNDFIKFPMVGTDPDTPKLVQAFDAAASVEPAAGFIPDLEPVALQVANVYALADEFGFPLVFGVVDPDEVNPQYIEKLKAAGIQDIADEMQKQLDAYLAGN